MLKRTITGIVAALFAVCVLAFRDTPALSIVVAIFTVIAAREIEKVIGIKNKAIYYISLAFSGLVPLFYEFRPELEQRGIVIPVTAVVVIYCVVLFMLMLTDFENTKFEEVASVIISTTFVPWSFSTLIFLNDMSETYPTSSIFTTICSLYCSDCLPLGFRTRLHIFREDFSESTSSARR